MKLIPTLALGAVLTLSAGIADAAPWFWGGHDRDHRPVPPRPNPHESYRRDRLEARVQYRLRQLGYYRGPIDGDFGRGSRHALVRFQRDRHLPMTGRIDSRTLRALGIR